MGISTGRATTTEPDLVKLAAVCPVPWVLEGFLLGADTPDTGEVAERTEVAVLTPRSLAAGIYDKLEESAESPPPRNDGADGDGAEEAS